MAKAPYEMSEAEIRDILLSDHSPVRKEFQQRFGAEIDQLGTVLYEATARLREFAERVGGAPDLRGAWVDAYLFAALQSVMASSQLLIAGFLLPAGNLMRSYGEAVAMALLVCLPKTGVLQKLQEEDKKYPVQKAIGRVNRKSFRDSLEIRAEGWRVFMDVTKRYDDYSHTSEFAVASLRKFSQPGTVIFGSEFDEAKVAAYRKELRLRVSAAERIPELIHAAEQQVLRARSAASKA